MKPIRKTHCRRYYEPQPTCVPFDELAAVSTLFRGVVGLVDPDLVGVVVVPLHDL